ncbi:ICOS ligand isoform X2 [Pogona vitticeps]
MASRSLGVVVLFLWLQRPGSANENEVIGILGSSVELECRYADEKSLDKLRVLWQANSKSCLVNAHFPNKREKAPKYCEEFRSRTLFNNETFSLEIWNVTPGDEGTYECVVQRNKTMEFELDHKASTALKVAANYSKPTITRLGNEMTFTCNSSHGFPEPKLHWTIPMDNSLYNITEQPATSEPDGTFSISSTIKIKSASNIKLECTIENVRLLQSITTIFETNSSGGSGNNSALSASPAHRPAILSTLALLLILPVILYICWEKRLCPGRTYAGICVEEAVCTNADVETENSLISGTEHR